MIFFYHWHLVLVLVKKTDADAHNSIAIQIVFVKKILLPFQRNTVEVQISRLFYIC